MEQSRLTKTVMHPLIDQHRAEIALLCHRYGVRQLEVFGSAARGADFDPDRSDADFLVDFERESNMSALHQFFGFAEALERLLGRPVDLVERGAIKNPFLLASIDRARELVYAE
jgi:predicted nucleotidyltransferase